MLKFDINDGKILYCYITDENLENAEFVDGVAVVIINVIKTDASEYECPTVVRQAKGENGENLGIFFESMCKLLFPSEDTISINRIGNHFLVERLVYDYERTKSRKEIIQIDYVDGEYNKKFIERSKLPGAIQLVNDRVVIVTPEHRDKSCLFSLEKSDIQSMEFTCIDNIDGESFLVTDTVALEEDQAIKDRLMFKMDSSGKRTSPVYIRSKQEFTKDDLSYPYLLIKERRISELKDELKEELAKEKEAEKALRKG